jgi:small subunit ribosomal protein S1
LQKEQQIKCVVLEVDEDKQRISLGIKQLTEDPWLHAIPEKYLPGQIVKGTVTKITNFGVFVELEPDLEGLLHISEIADHKIDSPQDVVKPAQEIEVKILRVDSDSRKIGLSMRRVKWAEEDQKHSAEKPQSPPLSSVEDRKGESKSGLDGLQIPPPLLLSQEGAGDVPQEIEEHPHLPSQEGAGADTDKTE